MRYLIVGDIIVDILRNNTMLSYDNGGSAFNVAYLINQNDKNSQISLCGVAGNDFYFEKLLDYFNRYGWNVSLIKTIDDLATNRIYINHDGHSSTYSIYCPSCHKLLWRDNTSLIKIPLTVKLDYDYAIFDNINIPNVELFIKKHSNSIKIMFDIDDTSINNNDSKLDVEIKLKKLSNSFYVQINGETFNIIKKKLNLKTELDITKYLRAELISITRSSFGTTFLYHGHIFKMKFKIENIIDNTGAGDSLMAAVVLATQKENVEIDYIKEISKKLITKTLKCFGSRPDSVKLDIQNISFNICDICGGQYD